MTLGQFFEQVSQNPTAIKVFLVGVPFVAFLSLIFGKGEGHLSPWKYLYGVLVYLASIPGIFAVTLSIYMFLFERRSIMDTNIYTQILPVLCMLVTLWLIRRNVDLKDVPGFDRIGGLVFMIVLVISMMWIMEKTNIFVFTFMPFYQFVLMFVGFLILVRYLWSRMIG
jgi:hypothetical protein